MHLQPYIANGNEPPRMIARALYICGFIGLTHIGSPMSISRHLVLPNDNESKPSEPTANADEAVSFEDDIKTFYNKHDGDDSDSKAEIESALILLHGAMKFENLAAVVLLGDEWYGFLHTHTDSKRKSNVLLTILPPGISFVPIVY